MKINILLLAMLCMGSSLSAMNSEDPQSNEKGPFWKNWKFNAQQNIEFFKQNTQKITNNVQSAVSPYVADQWQKYKGFFGIESQQSDVQAEKMKKIIFGTATDFEEVHVTFKKMVLPWYKKNPFKLAAITGFVGFFTGSYVGWKVKSYFSKKKDVKESAE